MKFTSWLLCFLLVFAGGYCAIDLYKQITAESYIRGSIDIQNRFTMESFNYVSTGLIFYNDLYDETETYIYTIDLKPVDDFNGQKNSYKVVLNNYIMLDTVVSAGAIDTNFEIDFYQTDGSLVCSATMIISIKFLSNKTTLTLSTNGSQQASFLEQYFNDNGIRLYVNEIIKGGAI